jgi:hypothetical protein
LNQRDNKNQHHNGAVRVRQVPLDNPLTVRPCHPSAGYFHCPYLHGESAEGAMDQPLTTTAIWYYNYEHMNTPVFGQEEDSS